MRQLGIIAAAGLFALRNNIERLAKDHANAKRLASHIQHVDGLSMTYGPPDTNILFIDVDESKLGTAPEFVEKLVSRGVSALPESKTRIRALTHLDVTDDQIDVAAEAFVNAAAS